MKFSLVMPWRIAFGLVSLVALFAAGIAVTAQVAETYTLTDLTGWTSNQLAALPWFARWIPTLPPGAPAYFTPVARNGAGMVAGDRAGDPYAPDQAAYVFNGTNGLIVAWGGHSWSYWTFDGEDWHYHWGRVEYSHASDLNALGFIAGHSTIETPHSENPLDSIEHAFLFDPATGWKSDLTPDGAGSARVYRLNDCGVLIGNYATASNYLAFRREPDGTMNFFTHPVATVQPMVLNNAGLVAGIHTTYTVSNRIVVPWIASNTTTLTPIPLPSPGNPDTCAFTDLNQHGLLVGAAWKLATPWETTAVRWHAQPNGTWVAEDLNDLIDAGNYILDRVLALNDAGHLMVQAHLDTPNQERRMVLLTPDVLPPPTVVWLPAASLTPTSAVLRAQVNACDTATTPVFQWGLTPAYTATNPAAGGALTGTVPTLVSASLTGLSPHTTYHGRAVATNTRGSTATADFAFTTPYDYRTWAQEKFGAQAGDPQVAGPLADPDHDRLTNLAEFFYGLDPLVADVAPLRFGLNAQGFWLSYPQALDRFGVTAQVEVATDLAGPWNSGPGQTALVETHRENGRTWTTIRSVLPTTNARQFLRLRLHGPP